MKIEELKLEIKSLSKALNELDILYNAKIDALESRIKHLEEEPKYNIPYGDRRNIK